jgi:hypothetical protein
MPDHVIATLSEHNEHLVPLAMYGKGELVQHPQNMQRLSILADVALEACGIDPKTWSDRIIRRDEYAPFVIYQHMGPTYEPIGKMRAGEFLYARSMYDMLNAPPKEIYTGATFLLKASEEISVAFSGWIQVARPKIRNPQTGKLVDYGTDGHLAAVISEFGDEVPEFTRDESIATASFLAIFHRLPKS